MILAIDVGNTNVVMGCIEKGNILNVVRLHTDVHDTDAEYAIKIKQILEIYGRDPRSFEGAIISSVVPEVTDAIKRAVKWVSGLNAMVVGPGMKTGLNVHIDDPSTLAGDLVVGSVAASACYGAPVIILDMGTATTMVVVDKNKCYVGGAIMPGINLSYEALASGTSLLPSISIKEPKKAIGTSTVESMRSGAIYGTASMVDGMIDRMEEELGYKCKIVANGGLAKSVVPYCRHKISIDNDLLIKGLWILYDKNRK